MRCRRQGGPHLKDKPLMKKKNLNNVQFNCSGCTMSFAPRLVGRDDRFGDHGYGKPRGFHVIPLVDNSYSSPPSPFFHAATNLRCFIARLVRHDIRCDPANLWIDYLTQDKFTATAGYDYIRFLMLSCNVMFLVDYQFIVLVYIQKKK